MATTIAQPKLEISAGEMERRRKSVQYAAAHNRIEGQFFSAEGAAIFEAFVRGDIDRPEIRRRLDALYQPL